MPQVYNSIPGANLREYRPKHKKVATDILLDLTVLQDGTVVELPSASRELPRNRPRLHSASSYVWTDRTGWVIVDTSDLKPL